MYCSKCYHQLADDLAIRLWDGKDYCQSCVAGASPLLQRYASESSVLRESVTLSPRELIRDQLFAFAFLSLIVVGVIVWTSKDAWVGALFGLAVCFVVFLLRVGGIYVNSKMCRCIVALEDGKLTIGRRSASSFTYDLSDCQWQVGTIRKATGFSKIFLRRKVVLLQCSNRSRWLSWLRQIVPCGITDETREVWVSFLQLAEVPVVGQ